MIPEYHMVVYHKGVTMQMAKPRYVLSVMRKPTFCICENKAADQLRGPGRKPERWFSHDEAHMCCQS